jgi:hypothetical protein
MAQSTHSIKTQNQRVQNRNVQYTWSDNKTVIYPYVGCNSAALLKRLQGRFEDQSCRIRIKLCAFSQTLHQIPSKCQKKIYTRKFTEIHKFFQCVFYLCIIVSDCLFMCL